MMCLLSKNESRPTDQYTQILKNRDELSKAVARENYDLSSLALVELVHQINQCAAQLLRTV